MSESACCVAARSTPLPVAGCGPDGRHLPVFLHDLLDLPPVSFGTSAASVNVMCAGVDEPDRNGWHVVRVDTDWSVDTPHDLDAERIAVALGARPGGCSEFVERVLPAVREHLDLVLRRILPPVVGQSGAAWRVSGPVGACCDGDRGFPTAQQAAAHVGGLPHLAMRYDADLRAVRRFAAVAVSQCRRLRATPTCLSGRVEAAGAGRHVQEDGGLRELWRAGLHPRLICRAHALLGVDDALPVDCYLALLGRRPDLVWVAETAALAPGSRLHTWLAETETALDLAQPEARARWLRAGIPHHDIVALGAAGYAAGEIEVLANARATASDAVAALRSWTARGLAPSVTLLSALHERGFSLHCSVEREVLGRLRRQLAERDLARDVSDEALAALVLVCGHTVPAFLWIKAGWADPVRVADAIARGDTSDTATA